jgi:hypothetical protein
MYELTMLLIIQSSASSRHFLKSSLKIIIRSKYVSIRNETFGQWAEFGLSQDNRIPKHDFNRLRLKYDPHALPLISS